MKIVTKTTPPFHNKQTPRKKKIFPIVSTLCLFVRLGYLFDHLRSSLSVIIYSQEGHELKFSALYLTFPADQIRNACNLFHII